MHIYCISKCTRFRSLQLLPKRHKTTLVSLSSLRNEKLGPSILLKKGNGSNERTQVDLTRRTIIFAKACSFGSSTFGLVMIPVLNSFLIGGSSLSPGLVLFTGTMNAVLGLLTFTPLLLHFLVKRFTADLHYNRETKVFTSIHYNVFLRKRALQFKSEDVTDIDNSPQKFYFPLATCTIHSLPILLNLEESQYTDNEAFRLLTHNIQLPGANKR